MENAVGKNEVSVVPVSCDNLFYNHLLSVSFSRDSSSSELLLLCAILSSAISDQIYL